eukprot:CAMPEP_0181181748 /NCGR_PEP_ID=MMETSP1096-20121128/7505_1 /TAXON_ID=156174 ORGANISM="Chrysochromulina ericina, Strain CCMP281" /NCGR_SAMPLE_ID=MMETSP1096 /ASSEMBLY_ACC=CAM_ASM_000453 /LENGTH=109 /DNA_ID=CAMNT_0023270277 /DNA_START=782 /DNA_END=1109 /DNA_ORIENTATION=-
MGGSTYLSSPEEAELSLPILVSLQRGCMGHRGGLAPDRNLLRAQPLQLAHSDCVSIPPLREAAVEYMRDDLVDHPLDVCGGTGAPLKVLVIVHDAFAQRAQRQNELRLE